MPRVVRGLIDGGVYHVLNRGNGRREVFHKSEDFSAFIDLMELARERHPVKIYAYCLLPNHFHLLVKAERGLEVSRFMQWLMTCHVRRYHRHYGTSGHVWQGRFKSFIVQENDYLLNVARYIEGNPIRAGLVSTARAWEWSSHKERCDGGKGRITDPMPLPLPGNWTEFVDIPATEGEKEKFLRSIQRQSPFGLQSWELNVSRMLGLESSMRPRGRPRKDMKK